MNRKYCWFRFVVFGLTFYLALLLVNITNEFATYNGAENISANYQNQKNVKIKNETGNKGRGASGLSERKSQCWEYCRVCSCEVESPYVKSKKDEPIISDKSKPLQITYKPKPKYTAEARNNNIQGNVRVRVTFLANGEIGSVSEVAGLPFGLTEETIEAAKKIKFKPQIQNDKPVSVTKVVAYTFTIY